MIWKDYQMIRAGIHRLEHSGTSISWNQSEVPTRNCLSDIYSFAFILTLGFEHQQPIKLSTSKGRPIGINIMLSYHMDLMG